MSVQVVMDFAVMSRYSKRIDQNNLHTLFRLAKKILALNFGKLITYRYQVLRKLLFSLWLNEH